MQSMEGKLQNFSQKVFNQARSQCDDIIKQAKQKADERISAYETQCLEEAYKNIQKQVGHIKSRESHRTAALRRQLQEDLLSTRESMMSEVFSEVLNRIDEFSKGKDYKNFLISCIENAIDELGEGDKEVFVGRQDEKYIGDIRKSFENCAISILEDPEILGGCVVLNKTSARSKNNTIARRLKNQRSEFVKTSGLIL